MRRILSLSVILLLSITTAFAQTPVKGTVMDAKSGSPLSGASIKIKGTNKGVSANEDGSFSIDASSAVTLEVSMVGFATKTVKASPGQAVSVMLESAAKTDVEVVVTALGQQRQAKQLGYSTAKVKASELTQAKVVNLQNGLTGKVSGLNIQTTNNGVFADTRITLRGIRSLTGNNQPMLVVDGVPVALSFISSLNPNDIDNVTILKSSSSTAIYGPDGVNGAIVITTKRGSKASPMITLSHTTQVEKVSFMPKLQTRFGSGSSIDANGYGVYDPIENQGYGDAFDGSLRQIGRDGPNGEQYLVEYIARPEEKKKFWDIGMTNQTDLSFSTGDFYLSAQNVNIKGIVPKDENKRINVRMRAEKEYNRFKAIFNLNYTQSNYNVTTQPDRDHSPYWLLLNSPMQIPITRFKNWQTDFWSHPDNYFNDYYSNPYFIIDNYRTKGKSDEFLGNVELSYKITPELALIYRLGGTFANAESRATRGFFVYSDFAKDHKAIAASGDLNASVSTSSAFSSRVNSEVFATYAKKFSNVTFDALVGQSFREINSKNVGISSNNLGRTTLFNPVVRKGEPTVSDGESKQRLERFFGKLAFGYDNWAFIEGTASYDIDSRLANPYKPVSYGDIGYFYPGVSASFVLSEAIPSLKEGKYLNYLKLRGALSKTGNVNLAPYSLENKFAAGTFFPYGTIVGFQSTGVSSQPEYQPEFIVNREAGIELGFLKNRINFEATAYHQDNSNQIITVAYSATTGFPQSVLNAASFVNKGLEFDLKLTPLIKIKDVNIDFKINYTHQTSEITKILDGVDELGVGNANFAIVGRPAFVFKLTDYLRDDQGRVIVDKTTGMPEKNPNTSVFGKTLPDNLVGLGLNVNWKGLSLSAVADYRGGNQIYSGNFAYALDFSGVSERSAYFDRRPFIFPNSVYLEGDKYVENKDVYTKSYGYNFWSQDINTGVQSNYISSGAFWKLREVAINYTLPVKRLFKGTVGNTIKGLSVGIVGRNLLTWLPESNQWTDPEFSNSNSSNGQGVNDLFNTAPTRIFGANVTVNF